MYIADGHQRSIYDSLKQGFISCHKLTIKYDYHYDMITYDFRNKTRDAPVDRPKIGTGRFLLIMRDRQPAGFCLFFGRFFRKCEHVICVEGIRQEHNKHRKTDTMKRTAVGVTLLAHK